MTLLPALRSNRNDRPWVPTAPGLGGADISSGQGLRTTPLQSRGVSPPEHTEQPEAGDEEQCTHILPAARVGVQCALWGRAPSLPLPVCLRPLPLTLAALGLHPTGALPQALF